MKNLIVLKQLASLTIMTLAFIATICFCYQTGTRIQEKFFNEYQYTIEKDWRTSQINLYVMAESLFWDNPKNDSLIGIATDKNEGNWKGDRYIFTHTKKGIVMTYQSYEISTGGGIEKVYSQKVTTALEALLIICFRVLLSLVVAGITSLLILEKEKTFRFIAWFCIWIVSEKKSFNPKQCKFDLADIIRLITLNKKGWILSEEKVEAIDEICAFMFSSILPKETTRQLLRNNKYRNQITCLIRAAILYQHSYLASIDISTLTYDSFKEEKRTDIVEEGYKVTIRIDDKWLSKQKTIYGKELYLRPILC